MMLARNRESMVQRLFVLACCVLALTGCPTPSPSLHEQLAPLPGEVEDVIPGPGDAGVTWDGWAGEFVRAYCVPCHSPTAPCGGNGCHASGDPTVIDFRDKQAITDRAPVIRCGIAAQQDPAWSCGSTTPKTFPKVKGYNPIPLDDQRAVMVGWFDAGCP
jgi:hypothetical protein